MRQRVPSARKQSTKGETKLARTRLRDNLTQQQMAEYTGMSARSYRRVERGERIPSIAELANCATVLGVDIEDLIEDVWRGWHVLSPDAPAPPDHRRFWHKRTKP